MTFASAQIAAVGGRASAKNVRQCPDCGRTIPTNGFFMHRPKTATVCRDREPHSASLPRFLRLVEKTGTCWLWRGSVHAKNGYGYFTFRSRNMLAHRFSFEAHVGPIPDGKVLDHTCRIRNCVNPAHLDLVTQSLNIARGNRWRQAEGA